MQKKMFFLCIIFLVSIPIFAHEIEIIGIQFQVSEEVYSSTEKFFTTVEKQITDVLSRSKPDLIIFPEYIGVFYQLIDYNKIIFTHDNFQDALTEIIINNSDINSMEDVFKLSKAEISYIENWSNLVKKYKINLIGGTFFSISLDGSLRNSALVFDETGRLMYRQNKVFLTDFEKDIIGLAPGTIEEAKYFYIKNYKIALTICRDAYFKEWETKNISADIWVDIKANGEVFDNAQKQSFVRALPLRMKNAKIKNGITVCTVGKYLDLFWEGASYSISNRNGKLLFIDVAESPVVFGEVELLVVGQSKN